MIRDCRLGWMAVCCVVGLLAGCAQDSGARFYLLSALEAPAEVKAANFTVSVAPVSLPGYLQRPQIVVFETAQHLQLAEFDRWAEPLEDNFARVLAMNLSALLAPEGGRAVYRQARGQRAAFQLHLVVERFDIVTDRAVLQAHWIVQDRLRRRIFADGFSRLEAPLESSGFEQRVIGYSELIRQLAREIAGEGARMRTATPLAPGLEMPE